MLEFDTCPAPCTDIGDEAGECVLTETSTVFSLVTTKWIIQFMLQDRVTSPRLRSSEEAVIAIALTECATPTEISTA